MASSRWHSPDGVGKDLDAVCAVANLLRNSLLRIRDGLYLRNYNVIVFEEAFDIYRCPPFYPEWLTRREYSRSLQITGFDATTNEVGVLSVDPISKTVVKPHHVSIC